MGALRKAGLRAVVLRVKRWRRLARLVHPAEPKVEEALQKADLLVAADAARQRLSLTTILAAAPG